MGNFYDEWLNLWSVAQAERAAARKSLHAEELEWIETRHDHRVALMISPETGFRTWGSTSLISEIPPGTHTGRRKHGEEAIFVLDGSGFSVVDDVRYDWGPSSVIAIPFGAVHQHFNTGEVTARLVSVLTVHLEHVAGLHRTTQLADRGVTTDLPDVPRSADGKTPDGAERIVLKSEEATVRLPDGTSIVPANMPDFDPTKPWVLSRGIEDMRDIPAGFHKSKIVNYMKLGKELNDFRLRTVEISGLLTDEPHDYGGLHAHMEALLYVISGSGYTLVDDEKIDWKPGTSVHIPGPQTKHRHVNESDEPATMIRMAFGFRYFWEATAKREFPYVYLAPGKRMTESNRAKYGQYEPR